jgi:UDP-N-acetylglucosamine 2-epimerase (non-hydrolysing)
VRRIGIAYVIGSGDGEAAMTPVIAAMKRRVTRARHIVVGSGDELDVYGLGEPDYRLTADSDSPVTATTMTMEWIERMVEIEQPSLVVTSGDSTTALSAALTALKLGIPCARIGAGLRSFDRREPEEVNRVIIDSFAELLCVDSEYGMANLIAEGVDPGRIHLVGSTVADTLRLLGARLEHSGFTSQMGIERGSYLLVALRERTLLGDKLRSILDRLVELSASMPIVMPVPRGIRDGVGGYLSGSRLRLAEPLPYLDLITAEAGACAVLTDLGEVQEKTTCMGTPCFTLRDSTEQMATVQRGTNRLIGQDPAGIAKIPWALRDRGAAPKTPPLWDGLASDRVVDALARSLDPIASERPTRPVEVR